LRNEIFIPQTEDELFEFLKVNGHLSRLFFDPIDLLPIICRGQEKAITLVEISR